MVKDMVGMLQKNDKKGVETRPDYRGRIRIDGQMYWLSSWINTDKESGEKYLSLKAEKAKPMHENKSSEREEKPLSEIDDDLPF